MNLQFQISHLKWFVALCALAAAGCATQASNNRDWTADQRVLSTAEFHGNELTVHNVRNCLYRSADEYVVRYEQRTYDLDHLETVDYIVVPFSAGSAGAHTMLSFGFDTGEHVAVSVEIRKENGEIYSPIKGLFNNYELMYVVGDERDLIGLRTNYRHDDVYVYRTRANRAQARMLMRDVMSRVNQLAAQPEFYNTVTNNCTTNVRRHANHIAAPKWWIPYSYQVLLPGYSDKLAYERGLIVRHGDFEQTKAAAKVDRQRLAQAGDADFSAAIRR